LARKGLPVEIIAEFDAWRKVRLHDNDEGWIHSSLLSSRRTIVIKDEIAELRRTPANDARIVLRAEPGVIGELLECEEDWCRVDIQGRRGWLRSPAFWGALPGETVH
jgi:SH3-like domain-containing protein